MFKSLLCADIAKNFYGFDFSIAPSLLFYSYLPIVLISSILSIFVYFKSKKSIQAKILLNVSTFFSLWIVLAIIQWTAVYVTIIQFSWQIMLIIEMLIYLSSYYFVLNLITNETVSYKAILFPFILSLPPILLTPTNLNIEMFNLVECGGKNGVLWIYIYFFEVVIIFLIVFKLIKKFILAESNVLKKQYILFLVGFLLFLGLFTLTNIFGDATLIYTINLVGPLGMLSFIILLSYTIVKYKAFNIKLAGAQVLVFALWFLVGSLLFVAKSPTTRIISGITLLFTTIAGYLLVRSVKREIDQREKIQSLAENLAQANIRLKELDRMKSEFVSIASHQLRSPLTSIRGFASMLMEGSYGKMPQTALPVLEKIADSSYFMAQSVEDYLNVSRIEAGNMKYELSDFNLKEQAEKIVDELRQVALKKGLTLVFRSDISGSGRIHADIGKVRQVIMNLIDNAMKYTPKGSIDVVAHDDPKTKRVMVTTLDTGIGMDSETLNEVFNKFVRAKNANNVNVTGTGLGLYVAKKMVDGMKGELWAESDGPGKGSRFHLAFTEI